MLLLLLGILLLQLFLKLVILTIHFVLQCEQMDDILTLLFGVLLKWMEISLVVLDYHLIDNQFLHIIRHFLANVDKEDQCLQEILLLAKVILILLTGNLEGIHGDRTFL